MADYLFRSTLKIAVKSPYVTLSVKHICLKHYIDWIFVHKWKSFNQQVQVISSSAEERRREWGRDRGGESREDGEMEETMVTRQ